MFTDHPLIVPFTRLEPDYFPEQELQKLIVHQSEITPLLLEALEDYTKNPENYDVYQGNYLPAVALTLLAQFREPAALPLFLKIVRSYAINQPVYDTLIFSTDDDEFGRIPASLACGDIDTLKSLVVDDQLEELMRAYALDALMACYFEGDLERSEFVLFLSEMYASLLSLDEDSDDYMSLWSALYNVSLSIHPAELMGNIRDMCEHDNRLVGQSLLSDMSALELADSVAS